MEAAAPRADGTGVSLPEAHRAPMGGRSRASRGGCGTRGGQRGRSRSAKGRARYRAPCSQGFDREASALEKGQEVRRIMGQKTHPYGFRLGYNKPFKSRWYAEDRKSTRLNSSHSQISYAVFCLKKKKCTSA